MGVDVKGGGILVHLEIVYLLVGAAGTAVLVGGLKAAEGEW